MKARNCDYGQGYKYLATKPPIRSAPNRFREAARSRNSKKSSTVQSRFTRMTALTFCFLMTGLHLRLAEEIHRASLTGVAERACPCFGDTKSMRGLRSYIFTRERKKLTSGKSHRQKSLSHASGDGRGRGRGRGPGQARRPAALQRPAQELRTLRWRRHDAGAGHFLSTIPRHSPLLPRPPAPSQGQ